MNRIVYWINKRLFRPEVMRIGGSKWVIVFYIYGQMCFLPYRFLSRSNAEAEMRRYFSEKIYKAQDFR